MLQVSRVFACLDNGKLVVQALLTDSAIMCDSHLMVVQINIFLFTVYLLCYSVKLQTKLLN
jgi:hypothetical protein